LRRDTRLAAGQTARSRCGTAGSRGVRRLPRHRHRRWHRIRPLLRAEQQADFLSWSHEELLPALRELQAGEPRAAERSRGLRRRL